MWIESLRLRNYPPIEGEKSFCFARGCTVVTGPNASGKTRLVEALRGTFFGFPEAAVSVDGFTEVVFHLGSRSFVLRRDFESCRILLSECTHQGEEIRHDGGGTNPEGEERFRTALAALLGTPEEVWMSSGFVKDGILEMHLDEAVRAWLVGNPQGDEEAILAQVEGDLVRLSGVGGDSGDLGHVRAEIEKRESLLEFWQDSAADAAQAREALREKEAVYQAAVLRAQERQSVFESLDRFDHLSQERGRVENSLVELREDRDRVRRHLEAEEQSRSLLESQYADFLNAPDDIEDGIHLWIEHTNRLQSAERELARLSTSAATIPPSRVARNGVIAASILGLLSWFAGMGAGEPKLGVFLFPLFASAGFAIVWALERSSERVRLAHAAERNRVETECREARASLEAARRALGKLGNIESPAALRKQFRNYMEVQEKLERARSLAAGLRPLSVIMDDYEEVLSQLQVLDTETRDLVAQARFLSGLDADLAALRGRVDTARHERDEAKGEVQQLTREVEELRGLLEPMGGGSPEPGRVAEELEDLRATLLDLARREGAARVAADMLREALREYQEDHLERVAVRASRFFESVSQGQYRELRFAEGAEPEVRGDGAWTPVAGLSRAVRDQLFFALRLALSEDGAGDRGLPIILDEPFRGWDEGRVAEARRLLDTLARTGRQCIVLGSDPRLLDWEGDMIRLERPDESTQALRAA